MQLTNKLVTSIIDHIYIFELRVHGNNEKVIWRKIWERCPSRLWEFSSQMVFFSSSPTHAALPQPHFLQKLCLQCNISDKQQQCVSRTGYITTLYKWKIAANKIRKLYPRTINTVATVSYDLWPMYRVITKIIVIILS